MHPHRRGAGRVVPAPVQQHRRCDEVGGRVTRDAMDALQKIGMAILGGRLGVADQTKTLRPRRRRERDAMTWCGRIEAWWRREMAA
jgi:hypothetical protein